MYKRIVYIGVFAAMLLSPMAMKGQDKISFAEADSLTYAFYMKENWKMVENVGVKAIEQGIDYYYLRMRVAISLYKRNRYASSIKHFEKAKEFGGTDPVLLEYLYYAYKFSGFEREARLLAREFPEALLEKMEINPFNFVESVEVAGGESFDPDYEKTRASKISDYSIYNERNLYRNSNFGNITLQHYLGKRTLLTHSFSTLYINRLQQIEDDYSGRQQFLHTTGQNQYYLNLDFRSKNGFTIKPALHFIWTNAFENSVTYDYSSGEEVPVFKNEAVGGKSYVFSLSASQKYRYWELGVNLSASNLGGYPQTQKGASLLIFPLGNLNLYSSTSFINHVAGPNSDNIICQTIGFRVYKFWPELSGCFGDLHNINTHNGLFVYNDEDITKIKAGINIVYPVNKRLSLSVGYNYQQKERNILEFSEEVSYTFKPTQYKTHSLTASMKFAF